MFEKSRGVSGRTSTRRAEPYFFDHGTQFFTAKSEDFQHFIAPLVETGTIKRWDARFIEIRDRKITTQRQWDEEYPHYVGAPAMNAIAKSLAHGLNVKVGCRVAPITKKGDTWHLTDEEGHPLGEFDWVICTAPAEQATDLLPDNLPFHPQIRAVKMLGCFSLMLGFDEPLPLGFDAALIADEDISWISVNSSKPDRNTPFSLLLHSTNKWADAHIDDERTHVLDYLCQQTSDVIGHDVSVATHQAVHGWRYANIAPQNGDTFFCDDQAHIGVCGDWFIQGRVEAAFTSGNALSKQILKQLLQSLAQ